ncbi:hypothetical protein CHS0354_030426 [Potamilus streckersoni]|uniref:Uncharacterized protein n=1 Tax=Potamilus streckersoni TaxID=2493646 RepID=A0AAE0S8U3_9BIVA|nr:hypothetical protein CHS0354_030426 [Potamilus streckersoni]
MSFGKRALRKDREREEKRMNNRGRRIHRPGSHFALLALKPVSNPPPPQAAPHQLQPLILRCDPQCQRHTKNISSKLEFWEKTKTSDQEEPCNDVAARILCFLPSVSARGHRIEKCAVHTLKHSASVRGDYTKRLHMVSWSHSTIIQHQLVVPFVVKQRRMTIHQELYEVRKLQNAGDLMLGLDQLLKQVETGCYTLRRACREKAPLETAKDHVKEVLTEEADEN